MTERLNDYMTIDDIIGPIILPLPRPVSFLYSLCLCLPSPLHRRLSVFLHVSLSISLYVSLSLFLLLSISSSPNLFLLCSILTFITCPAIAPPSVDCLSSPISSSSSSITIEIPAVSIPVPVPKRALGLWYKNTEE